MIEFIEYLASSPIEIIGYLGSFLVAMAMLFNSIIRLRWFSLVGSSLFTIYGFTIGAYPVGILNGFIMLTNIYYLIKMYSAKEYFRTLEIKPNNLYLKDFLEFNRVDIKKFFPSFKAKEHDISLLVLRNMQVAGVFLADKKGDEIHIKLDYVSPNYRDFKLAKYFFDQESFKAEGFKSFISGSYSKKNDNYLKKLGFKLDSTQKTPIFIKTIQ